MAKKIYAKQLLENPDGYTTAERSLINTNDISTLESEVKTIQDVVSPENLTFGDGTLANTQATRAEDIVSVEDERLQGEIDLKVSTETFEASQAAQDTVIASKADQTDLDDLQEQVDGIAGGVNIVELEERVTDVEEQVNTNTSDIASLDTRLTANELLDSQQNNRLDILEEENLAQGQDYSILKASGLVDINIGILNPTIQRDFDVNANIAVNVLDETTGELTTTITNDSTVSMDFYFNAEQDSGTLIDFTLELYNLTTDTVVDSSIIKLDFAGSTTINSGTRTVKGDVSAGDQVQIRVYTDVGSVNITEAGGDLQVSTLAGGGTTIYDNQVISTSVWGQVNTAGDLNAVYDRIKTNETSFGELQSQVDEKQDITEVSYNGTHTFVMRNQRNTTYGINEVYTYKLFNRDATETPTDYLDGDTRYGFTIHSSDGIVYISQEYISNKWTDVRPPINTPTAMVDKKYVDDAVSGGGGSATFADGVNVSEVNWADKLDVERTFTSSTSGISATIDNSNAQASGSAYTETYLGQLTNIDNVATTTTAGKIGIKVGTDGSIQATLRKVNGAGQNLVGDVIDAYALTTKEYVDNKIQVGDGEEEGVLYLVE